ncbi:MAG: hypothetical protein ACHQEB_07125 [Chitinophagales bacterium]
MKTKIIGEAILATLVVGSPILESYIKREEDKFHTHTEIEKPIQNSRMSTSIYGIEFNRYDNGKTNVGFPTMGIPYFLE